MYKLSISNSKRKKIIIIFNIQKTILNLYKIIINMFQNFFPAKQNQNQHIKY